VIRGSVAVLALLALVTSGSSAAGRSAGSNSDIYSIALDGSDLRRLTETPESEAYLSRSPDGTRLAYYATDDGTTYSIYVSNADGAVRRRLAPHSRTVDFRESPAWSLDGRQLVYAQGFGCGDVICNRQEVWTTDVMSGKSKRLAKSAVQPAWSATRLAYTRARLIIVREPSYRLNVVLARLDGSRPRVVVRGGEGASWSPSGRFLAYRGFDGYGPTHVFRVRNDGAQRRRLRSPFDPSVVSWSPDRRHIAIVGGVTPTLYVVGANGREFRSLGKLEVEFEQNFSWSPDGRRLAWARGRRIFVQAVTGGPRRTIAVEKGALSVVWSADGRRLFFVA
jgi:Tol biopolymer transport system component